LKSHWAPSTINEESVYENSTIPAQPTERFSIGFGGLFGPHPLKITTQSRAEDAGTWNPISSLTEFVGEEVVVDSDNKQISRMTGAIVDVATHPTIPLYEYSQ